MTFFLFYEDLTCLPPSKINEKYYLYVLISPMGKFLKFQVIVMVSQIHVYNCYFSFTFSHVIYGIFFLNFG